MPTTEAQRRAQKRYDAKRPKAMIARPTPVQLAWIDQRLIPGETRFKTLCRLAGMPEDI